MSTSTNTSFEFGVNHNGEFKLNPLTYQDGSLLNIIVPEMEFEDMIYVSHRPIDLSTVLIPNDGSLEELFAVIDGPSRKYVKGGTMNISIPRMKLDEVNLDLFNILGTKIHALYYEVPHTGFSSTVKLRNNYDMHVIFDISAVTTVI
ncbi:hypothetical protein Tco_1436279 [Tanacetum coccineum]